VHLQYDLIEVLIERTKELVHYFGTRAQNGSNICIINFNFKKLPLFFISLHENETGLDKKVIR